MAALPKGKASKWVSADPIAKGIVNVNFKRKAETPKAMASDLYHMPMDYNIENVVLADAAGQGSLNGLSEDHPRGRLCCL